MSELLVDCHRHFGGSIPTELVWDIICNHVPASDISHSLDEVRHVPVSDIAHSLDEVRRSMCFVNGEPTGFYRFLSKFNILDSIPWDEQSLRRSTQLIAEQILAESIDYTWVRLSVNKYRGVLANWPRWKIVELIRAIFADLIPGRVGLVLSLKYESHKELQTLVASDERIRNAVVGIDLVGSESYYSPEFYSVLLKPWKDAGKILFAHVGESCSKKNVITAIRDIGVTEVCHGVNAVDDPIVIELAKEYDVCFHMAISSNHLTGVVKPGPHPFLSCLRNGLKVTLGTDDPVQCSTTLQHEYELARNILNDYSNLDADDNINKLKAEAVNRVTKWHCI